MEIKSSDNPQPTALRPESAASPQTASIIARTARSLVGRAGFVPDDEEDLRQEMAAKVTLRVGKFDPSRASFNTFATHVLRNHAAGLVTTQRAKRRDHRMLAGSIDDDGFIESRLSALPQWEIAANASDMGNVVARQLDIGRVIGKLDPSLQDLCERLKVNSVSEVARAQGMSRASVYDAIREIREHFVREGIDAPY